MENLPRTVQFAALMQSRRRELGETLAPLLPPNSSFVWEIGCGHGHFLTAYAAAHPAEVCLGIDLAGDRIARANRKRDRAGAKNLHFLQADARLFLETLPAGVRFSRLFVLFPDPWPKLRHHKHRIMLPDFLNRVAQRAGEGARLYFRTDHVPYFEATRSILNGHTGWSISDDAWAFEHQTVFQNRSPTWHSLVAKPHQASA